MSDASQGPGWWQASDGKWYAPELHPDYTPPDEPAVPDATTPIAPMGGEPTTPISTPPAGPPTAAFPTVPPAGGPPAEPPPGAGVPPSGGGGGGSMKWVALVIVVLLVAGGIAFAATRSSGGSKDKFCQVARDRRDDLNLDFDAAANRSKLLAAGDALLKASPKEIKADVQTVVDTFKRVDAAMRSAGSDTDSQQSAAESVFSEIDSSSVEAAGKHVDDYAKQNCGIAISTNFSESASNRSTDSTDQSTDEGTDFGSSFSSALDSFSSCYDRYSVDPASYASCVTNN